MRTGGTRGGRAQAPRGRDLETEVQLTFEQAVNGAQVPLAVPTSQPCPTCHGTGAKPGTQPKVCPVCNGRGVESQSQGIFSMSQPCSNCGGTGTVIDDPCPTCRGSGATRSVKRLRVNIPAGVRDGSRIRPRSFQRHHAAADVLHQHAQLAFHHVLRLDRSLVSGWRLLRLSHQSLAH